MGPFAALSIQAGCLKVVASASQVMCYFHNPGMFDAAVWQSGSMLVVTDDSINESRCQHNRMYIIKTVPWESNQHR